MSKHQAFSPQTSKVLNKFKQKPRIAILYHFMYPDDVVSARHLDGLASDLAAKGWDVEALPSNRGCRNDKLTYKSSDFHNGVYYNRIWRPKFKQSSNFGRLLNSLWMILAWTKLAFRRKDKRPHIILIGTDPIFAAVVAIPIKFITSKIRLVHWCFDLHPEASVASRMISSTSILTRVVKNIMRASYQRYDVIANIGPCMKILLRRYKHCAREVELTPWALIEPPHFIISNKKIRQGLFGDARLAILYSGNFGEAHSFEEILAVARSLRHVKDIHFCFAVRGNKVENLKKEISLEDINISFAGFAPLEELEIRLGAADIHMTSLRQEWSGIAVPSKFFGSLAIGRPVLFAGPSESAIAQWVNKFNVGWVLNKENIDKIAEQLFQLTYSPSSIRALQKRAHKVYTSEFSRSSVNKNWHSVLSDFITY